MQPPIIEAHWSKNPKDSHSENDADSTYAVTLTGEFYIFNTKQEAEDFLKLNSPNYL